MLHPAVDGQLLTEVKRSEVKEYSLATADTKMANAIVADSVDQLRDLLGCVGMWSTLALRLYTRQPVQRERHGHCDTEDRVSSAWC